MKLEERILLFDTINITNDIFPKTCKIDIPEKVPLTWNFQGKAIGFAEVTKDKRGLIAKFETFPNELIGIKDIGDVLTDGKMVREEYSFEIVEVSK